MIVLKHSRGDIKSYHWAYISKMEEEVGRTLRTVSSHVIVLTQSISPSNALAWWSGRRCTQFHRLENYSFPKNGDSQSQVSSTVLLKKARRKAVQDEFLHSLKITLITAIYRY